MTAQSSHGRKVFAHYFTPYPISIDNQPADSDYYSVHYLKASGEGGKFAASGGLLRDRPLPRKPIDGDYVLADHRTEIQQAKQGGIDGWTLNLMDVDGINWKKAESMLRAADAEGGFSIVPMPDMTTIGWLPPDQMADLVKKVADHPSAHRLDDGRLMLSPFYADLKNASYWQATIAALEARGVAVAFMPTFIDWPSDPESFAKISYGFSMWGGRSPANVHEVYGPRTKALGLKWMQPVAVQDQRPTAGIYDESVNLATLRKSWELAIDQGADYVQMTTWNDYSEGTAFAPSQEHGWAFLDASAYYLSKFKTGSTPTITRDSLVLTHRKQPASAQPTAGQSTLMELRDNSSRAVDQVEVMAFLTAPGDVTATVGGRTKTWPAPAGVSVHTLPLEMGTVSASVSRDGQQTTAVKSDDTVTSSPAVQDLQYVASSSLR
ncbi:glycoside hydrolase family 71 protein [Luteococcus sp. OSA5]|uniref:glycoside hydrolase family 71 protein n=1 Tax=Luteococcus sp. OSA5 TaxID=3401630 RepID=UPI003B43A82C